MGSIAPVIGLSLADARIARRAALLVDALQLRCALDLLDTLPGGSTPTLILTDRRTPGATDPTDDRDVARQYVNRIDLDISLSEIRIDLGQAFPGEPMPRPQCRLVTSPSHLHTFESAIVSGIRTYESRFGTVLTDVADGALAHG